MTDLHASRPAAVTRDQASAQSDAATEHSATDHVTPEEADRRLGRALVYIVSLAKRRRQRLAASGQKAGNRDPLAADASTSGRRNSHANTASGLSQAER